MERDRQSPPGVSNLEELCGVVLPISIRKSNQMISIQTKLDLFWNPWNELNYSDMCHSCRIKGRDECVHRVGIIPEMPEEE